MNDDRFDRDLRSVLEDDAPRTVPDELRARVRTVPGAMPARAGTGRLAWFGAAVRFSVAAAVVAAAVLFGWSRLGPTATTGSLPVVTTSPGQSAAPTQAPTDLAASAHASPAAATPSHAPAPASPAPATASHAPQTASPRTVVDCTGADLSARILDWQGAAGSRIADVTVTNVGGGPCIFAEGTPRLELLDATGRIVLQSSGQLGSPIRKVTLAVSDALRTSVAASNACGPTPVLPLRISFTLPGTRTEFVASPATGVSSADAVPPCNGPVGGDLSMNGWTR
jgi:uncharacterized protein DUF4232